MLLVSVCASTWNLSGILDHVVESWAHLRPSFPRLPYDLVGVVTERYPDALLVGSVVCDNAYTPLNFFTLPEVFFVNLYQDAEQVLVLVISDIAINNAFIVVSIIFSFSNCKK